MIERDERWCGIHLGIQHDAQVDALIEELPTLAEMGLNVLVTEVNYHFAFASHPELRGDDPVTRTQAQALAAACHDHGIRLIPQFQCLGHQSWAETTFPLLTVYPEFDETPGAYPDNEDIYCRSWCPQHPQINLIIFDLFDELLEAFNADALHVGMDEVFLIGSDHCPRCRGRNPAELFAKAVNDYYGYLVQGRGVEMVMWGDRLLNAEATDYGTWEAAENGTDPAIDMIPTDIIQCDWHYTRRDHYPSLPIFLDHGFRVWPAGWKEVAATEALVAASLAHDEPAMLGHLCTAWGQVRPGELAAWPPIQKAMAMLKS
jgi:hypothetical protein